MPTTGLPSTKAGGCAADPPERALRDLLEVHRALTAAETPPQARACAAVALARLFPEAACEYRLGPGAGGAAMEGTDEAWSFARVPVTSPRGSWGALEVRAAPDRRYGSRDLARLELCAAFAADTLGRVGAPREAPAGEGGGARAAGGGARAPGAARGDPLPEGILQSDKLMILGQMAAGIAHQINNPLTAVSSHAQLLALKAQDPADAESALRIAEGVDRIGRLVQNLTSFVRSAEDGFYPLDVNQLVSDTLTFSRYDLTRGDTKLEEDLQSPLPCVLGSRDQLEHVLLNLLTNARDAVSGRGTIRVTTRAADGKVRLEVVDDGVGIDPGQLERIFEPFYTTKPPGKGNGLGLFVAAGIARRHGAELAVWSEPGRGTRLTLDLPAFPA